MAVKKSRCLNFILIVTLSLLFFILSGCSLKKEKEEVPELIKPVATNASYRPVGRKVTGLTRMLGATVVPTEYACFSYESVVLSEINVGVGDEVKEGDVILGLPSSGVHSNGYSLVRRIVFDHKGFKGDEYMEELGKTIGEELLTPTRLYPKSCLPLIEKFDIHGMVHITGGGFYENIPRALPEDLAVEIDTSKWEMPAIFRLLQQWGNVDWPEMYRTFNMGIGMILIVSAEEAEQVKAHLKAANETVYEIGKVVKGNHDVTLQGGVFVG